MKRLFILTTLALIAFNSTAQVTIPKMELKPTGFVENDTSKNFVVIEIPNKLKNELYKNSLMYLNSIYRNPQKVITQVENEAIIINGLTESIKGDLEWYKYELYYNINIQFKDGKIRFEPTITDLTEIWSENKELKMYIANTDSPNEVEINCIYMGNKKNKNNYFLYKDDLKLSIDNWLNSYITGLVNGITNNNW